MTVFSSFMKRTEHLRVSNPPSKLLLIWDGDCDFCRLWIERWREITADKVDYTTYQEAAGRFSEIPSDEFNRSLVLIQPDGTVLFTGASGSLRGKPGFAQFAAAKAGLRAVAQSMAREFGPAGLHVAHVVVDGGIAGERLLSRAPGLAAERGEDGLLDIDAIAETYWQIHRQHRSAWSFEVDLRPYKESF